MSEEKGGRDFFYEVAVAGGFIVDISVVVGWFKIDPAMMSEAAYSALRALAPLVIAVVSFLLGWFMRGRRIDGVNRKEARRQAKVMTAALESQHSALVDRKMAQYLDGLHNSDRMLLKVLVEKGEAYTSRRFLKTRSNPRASYPVLRFAEWEPVEGDTVRLTPNDAARRVYELCEDQLALFDADDFDPHLVYDPDKRKASNAHQLGSVPWWIYTDDPSRDAMASLDALARPQPPREME